MKSHRVAPLYYVQYKCNQSLNSQAFPRVLSVDMPYPAMSWVRFAC